MVKRAEQILVIEDEPDILELIEYNLRREGFTVSASQDGEEGLRLAREQTPDLVLLDLMLPRLSGVEVCRQLKADPSTAETSVIMVTARGEEEDVIAGLEQGADDYIPKPFSPKVLVARVKAVLRRRGEEREAENQPPKPGGPGRIEIEGLSIDPERHEVLVDGEPIVLTATEFRLLRFLAAHPGRVFTRNQLLDRVVGANSMVIDRNVDVHVGAIRKKLGPYRDLIETIRGVGYRFRDAASRR